MSGTYQPEMTVGGLFVVTHVQVRLGSVAVNAMFHLYVLLSRFFCGFNGQPWPPYPEK